MRVALVASSYAPNPGGLERHVEQLALGLARRGAQVEVLTQEAARRPSRVVGRDGVVVRRFRAPPLCLRSMSWSEKPATRSGQKPAKARRKFSRLRRIVIQDSPDWNASSVIRS